MLYLVILSFCSVTGRRLTVALWWCSRELHQHSTEVSVIHRDYSAAEVCRVQGCIPPSPTQPPSSPSPPEIFHSTFGIQICAFKSLSFCKVESVQTGFSAAALGLLRYQSLSRHGNCCSLSRWDAGPTHGGLRKRVVHSPAVSHNFL